MPDDVKVAAPARPRRLSATALATALALGVVEAFAPRRRIEVVEVDPWHHSRQDGPVRLIWSRDPGRTIALVRSRAQ